jgi:hypothetical protein
MTNLAWLGKQSRPLAWILGLVLLIAATGCDRSAKAAKTTEAPPRPPLIVADVVERAVPIYREYTARTEAVPTIEVRARVAGVLGRGAVQGGERGQGRPDPLRHST